MNQIEHTHNQPWQVINWYAIHTKPRQEKLAELTLQHLGVETFFPELRRQQVIRRTRQITISPLFPGYLFARFNMETRYRAVNAGRGIRKVVSAGTIPAVVDERIIESIKLRLNDGYVTLRPTQFVAGQTVRIQDGPFQGLDAVFEKEFSDHQRAMLLLQALSYQARVVVDLGCVVNG